MTKYDVELDLSEATSLGLIIKQITPGSRVLELGCAAGRLTRHLKEVLNCNVDIVEYDDAMGKAAAQYAETAIVGKKGDLNKRDWKKLLVPDCYDFIICADVLEHLIDPQRALEDCKTLLKDSGSLIISIPNMAHDGIFSELLLSQFRYRPLGLLDDTHLRFYTYDSLLQLLKNSGWQTEYEYATYCDVSASEFKDNLGKLDTLQQYVMTSRPTGDIYQYVFAIKKQEVCQKTKHKLSLWREASAAAYLYYPDAQGEFSEAQKISATISSDTGWQTYNFDLKNIKTSVQHPWRFDSHPNACLLRVRGQEKQLIVGSNATHVDDDVYFFAQTDPQIYFKPQSGRNSLCFALQILPLEGRFLESFSVYMQATEQQLQDMTQLKQLLQDQSSTLRSQASTIESQGDILQSRLSIIEEQSHLIDVQSDALKQQETAAIEIEQLKSYLSTLENQTQIQSESFMKQISSREELVESLKKQVHDKEVHIQNIESLLATTNQELTNIRASKLWLAMRWKNKCMRKLSRFSQLLRLLKTALLLAFKRIYHLGLSHSFNIIKNTYSAGGVKAIRATLKRLLVMQDFCGRSQGSSDQDYQRWIEKYDTYDQAAKDCMRVDCESWVNKPLISIVMPTYNTPDWALRACLDSVLVQTYPYWELCIADDASTQSSVRRTLLQYMKKDARIKVTFATENGHISRTSNLALKLATGEFVALLDHDDLLPVQALYEVAKAIVENPNKQLFYSDEDKVDENGYRIDPYFKSDWNPDLFLGHNMFSHLGVYKTDLLRQIDGFREGLEGSQDYDLALRCLDVVGHQSVYHIPHILYHWRIIKGSTAGSTEAKPYALIAATRAIREYVHRQGLDASVGEVRPNSGMIRVQYALPNPEPKVVIIIPTRNRADLVKQCIKSILEKTTYSNYEILLVDNGSDEADSLAYFSSLGENPKIQVVRDESPFNYSAINNRAVKLAQAEVLCLLNNDTEVINSDWLREMVSHAIRPDIGAVGAKLWYPDDTLQHGGVILNSVFVAGHIFQHIPRENHGYFGRAGLVQNYSAVTAACLVIRKSIFEAVGGFNEKDLQVAYNDVDFCIRVSKAGYRNLWTPFAELYHYESASRGLDEMSPERRKQYLREVEYMQTTHADALAAEPFINKNFDPLRGYFLLRE